jgi:putative FmdB family regulatory protein
MPIYDYLCTSCDHRADILHGINDPGPRFCLSCGEEGTMRKQFAAPAIHFKGSGWAKKDRGGSGSTKAAAKASSGDAREGDSRGSDAKGSDSGESKASDSPSSATSDTPKPSSTD